MADRSRQPVYDLASDHHADMPPARPPKRAFMCSNPAYGGDRGNDDGPPLPPKKSGPGALNNNPAYRAASTTTTAPSTYELEDTTPGESIRSSIEKEERVKSTTGDCPVPTLALAVP